MSSLIKQPSLCHKTKTAIAAPSIVRICKHKHNHQKRHIKITFKVAVIWRFVSFFTFFSINFKYLVRTLWSVNDVQPEYGLNELVHLFKNKPWRVSGGRVCDCTSLTVSIKNCKKLSNSKNTAFLIFHLTFLISKVITFRQT